MNAVITDESGSSARGNAVLRISRRPPTTDFAPVAHRVRDEVVGEQPGQQVGEEAVRRVRPPRRMSTSTK